MGAADSSSLRGVSTNARADDIIPRPFWNVFVATIVTVAKQISRFSLHLALANIHHARLSFCSRDPLTFEAPMIPLLGHLGTNFDPKLLGLVGDCTDLLGVARNCQY